MRNWTKLTCMVILIFACVAVTAQNDNQSTGTSGQDLQHLAVSGSRPIAKALDNLGVRYGWVVSYEDPKYSSLADIQDITTELRKPDSKGTLNEPRRKVIIPKRGALHLEYAVKDGRPKEGIPQLISRLLHAYAAAGNPQFAVIQSGNSWHVVPSRVHDEEGSYVPVSSILDTVISIPPQKRTALGMLQAICDSLSTATGSHVVVGMVVPLNVLYQHSQEYSASVRPAREILTDVLEHINPQFTWRLFYDPGVEWYGLNVVVVPKNNSATHR